MKHLKTCDFWDNFLKPLASSYKLDANGGPEPK